MGLILVVVVTILGCYGVYLLIKLKDSLPADCGGRMMFHDSQAEQGRMSASNKEEKKHA